jgi:hypothetical protein
MPNVIMLNVVMVNVILPSVVLPNVLAPAKMSVGQMFFGEMTGNRTILSIEGENRNLWLLLTSHYCENVKTAIITLYFLCNLRMSRIS